jgi:glycosyltransferase involved in cell wall biosynthesis
MKILLSAFACAPAAGSEGGVGWRWALELAVNHEVTVVTDSTRRNAIEAVLAQSPHPKLRIVYFRPAWLKSMPLNSSTAQLLYTLWQFGLLPFARRLHQQYGYDLAMHISYGVHRHPSFLGYLGIPFVFGPLGGGEDAPLRLKRSITGPEKTRELLRSGVNMLAMFDPFLWIAYAKASLILVKTEDTRNALPWPYRKRAIVYQEIGIDVPTGVVPATRPAGVPLRVLYAGRLLGLKGVHFAIRAMAELWHKGVACEFTLVGRGAYEAELRQLARELGVEERIRWINYLPQAELFALYREMHCLLFPSLHDSSGNVVLESQAYGVPVICLDLGGPPTLVTPDTGIVVSTRNQDEDGVVRGLINAVEQLAGDETRRAAMGRAAIAHVSTTMRWENRVCGVLKLAEGVGRGD